MALYDNAVCPVCHNLFEDGDDVVFCPECGTPHHRECYSLAGHCANEGLHKSGYNFYEENKPKEEINKPEKESDESASEIPPFLFGAKPDENAEYNNSGETIDGYPVSDIACTVRTNANRFVNIFRNFENKKKKTSWNWGAFLFGSFYFFFRKMYMQGTALLTFGLALITGSNFAYEKFAPKASEAMIKLSELYASGDADAVTNAVNALNKVSDIKNALLISYISIGIFIAIRVIAAIFADGMYKKRVKDIIETTCEILSDEEFVDKTPYPDSQKYNISNKQLMQLYLARQGGTSFFAPLIAFVSMEIILRLISTYLI